MSTMSSEAIMVRVYLAGTAVQRELLLRRLRDWEHARGATVFVGVAGFGDSGSATGEAMPTVLEFFDEPDRARQVIADLRMAVDGVHIVHWPVSLAVSPAPSS